MLITGEGPCDRRCDVKCGVEMVRGLYTRRGIGGQNRGGGAPGLWSRGAVPGAHVNEQWTTFRKQQKAAHVEKRTYARYCNELESGAYCI